MSPFMDVESDDINGDGERDCEMFLSLWMSEGKTGGEMGLGECEGDECEFGDKGGVVAVASKDI